MQGTYQPSMVAGPVKYKRKYTLWVLIVLILVCWPAAIVYWFTREKVPTTEFQTYATPSPYAQPPPPPPMASGRFCSACGTSNAPGATFCSKCGKPLG